MAINLHPQIRCTDVRHNGKPEDKPLAVAGIRDALAFDRRLLPRCATCLTWLARQDTPVPVDAVALVPLRVRRATTTGQPVLDAGPDHDDPHHDDGHPAAYHG